MGIHLLQQSAPLKENTGHVQSYTEQTLSPLPNPTFGSNILVTKHLQGHIM